MAQQTKAQQTKGKKKEREEVDVFADMMDAGVFTEDGHNGDFADAFSSTVVTTTPSTRSVQLASLGERIAREHGFQPSKEQSFDIPIERVLDSPYQEREKDKRKWTDKQRQEYERLRKAVREGLNEVFFVAAYPGRPGYVFLTYGAHNRRDAARDEGHTVIPCVFVEYDEQKQEDQERVGFGTTFENEIKIPMTLEERGRLYRRLMRDFKLSQEKLAKRLDVTRDFIKDRIMVAESDEDVRDLVRALDTNGGIRIARSLNRLGTLADLLAEREGKKQVDAPSIARAPLIEEYRTGNWKVELIEAYIDQILLLAQKEPSLPIEEILNRVFHPETNSAQYEEDTRHEEPSPVLPMTKDLVDATIAHTQQDQQEPPLITVQPAIVNRDTPPATTSFPAQVAERRETSTTATSDRTEGAENALRLDKLLKAQKYLDAYCKLTDGKHKGDQEMSILTAMAEIIQEELVLQ